MTTSTASILDAALDLLESAKGQSPSFVDCLVIVYADVYKTTEIFGFDEDVCQERLPTPRGTEHTTSSLTLVDRVNM